jgi:ATP-dependent Clp protease adapter protein ClpS
MGLRSLLQSLFSNRSGRPEAWPPVHVDGSPSLKNEFDLALFLLDQPEVAALLEERHADITTIKRQTELGRTAVTRESCENVRLVVQQPRLAQTDAHVDLLLKLLSFGTDEIRTAFTTASMKPGDIPFALAHGQSEAQLRAAWPTAAASRSVEIVNDDYSPMECVYPAIERELALTDDAATVLMLRIHRKGAIRVAPPAQMDPESFCVRANAAWRQAGLALYCRPSAQPNDA